MTLADGVYYNMARYGMVRYDINRMQRALTLISRDIPTVSSR